MQCLKKKRLPLRLELAVSSLLLVVIVLLMMLQIISRYFSLSPIWTEELMRWLWVWMACIGMAEVERNSEHVIMDFFPKKLRGKAHIILLLCFDLVSLMVMLDLSYLAWRSVKLNGDTFAVTMNISRGLLYLGFLIASIFINYRIICNIWKWLKILKRKSKDISQQVVSLTDEL